MHSVKDPYSYLISSYASSIYDVLSAICPSVNISTILQLIEEPPRREFGDLSLPINRLLKLCREELSPSKIISNIKLGNLFTEVKYVNGYLNAYVNDVEYAKLVVSSVRSEGLRYGFIPDDIKLKVVVEYVSANPVHPLHIGSGRNAVLGEFISRILEVKGHRVQRRYYINDLGRQVATLVYGYMKLGMPEPPPDVRPDIWFGFLYAVTNTIMDIVTLKRVLSNSNKLDDMELRSKQAELDELVAILSELRVKNERIVDTLLDSISKDDPEKAVEELMARYESGDPQIVKIFRYVVTEVISGIQKTLERLGIVFDRWDWESDLVFNGLVKEVVDLAKRSDSFTVYKGAPALDFSKLQNDPELRRLLRLPRNIEIPPLILMRSDGTTLYVTRDIAYTIAKFKDFNADMVINVIANEQTLAQAQLRLALYALGFKDEAVKTIHYSYELVTLPGIKMSGRRGRYVSVDQILDSLEYMVEEVLKLRGSTVTDQVKRVMGVGAFKYMMLASSPTKSITFNLEEALNLNKNSAPYLQYTYARTCGVLSKYGENIKWDLIDYTGVSTSSRRELLHLIGKFPYIISKVSKDLDPEILIAYLNKLADTFNSWYDKEPILREGVEGIKQLKLFITYATGIVLRNGLYVMGIDVLERI